MKENFLFTTIRTAVRKRWAEKSLAVHLQECGIAVCVIGGIPIVVFQDENDFGLMMRFFAFITVAGIAVAFVGFVMRLWKDPLTIKDVSAKSSNVETPPKVETLPDFLICKCGNRVSKDAANCMKCGCPIASIIAQHSASVHRKISEAHSSSRFYFKAAKYSFLFVLWLIGLAFFLGVLSAF